MSTGSQLNKARKYAAQPHHDMAAHAFDADYGFASHVTHEDKVAYANHHINMADEVEAGEHDHNFTIRQRMNYYLTGECVAILP